MKGRTALVTGGAQRIGKAIAVALAKEGTDVVIHCNRSQEEAKKTVQELRDLGCCSSVIQCDLTDVNQSSLLFAQARYAAGCDIDILINNASIFNEGAPCSVTAEEFSLNMNIHTVTPLLLSQCLAAQICGGDIINILDTRILECDNEHAAYHLSKRTLFTLTRMLAKELAPTIRVNGVAPGLVLPPPGKDESYIKEQAHSLPLQHHGRAEDVADAVIYLLKSSFVTGQVIYVDGGRHLRGSSYEP